MPFTVQGSKYMYRKGRAYVSITISDEQVYSWYEELEAAKRQAEIEAFVLTCSECELIPAVPEDYLCATCRVNADYRAEQAQLQAEEDRWEHMRQEAMQEAYNRACGLS